MSKAFKLIVINGPPCLPSYVVPPSLPPPTQTDQPSDAVKKPVSDSLFPHCLLPPSYLQPPSQPPPSLKVGKSPASNRPASAPVTILPPAPFSASSICQGGQVTNLKQANIWSCVTILPHESRTLTTELFLPPWCQHKTGGFVLRMDWFHSLRLVAVAQPWQLFHCYDSIPLLRP